MSLPEALLCFLSNHRGVSDSRSTNHCFKAVMKVVFLLEDVSLMKMGKFLDAVIT